MHFQTPPELLKFMLVFHLRALAIGILCFSIKIAVAWHIKHNFACAEGWDRSQTLCFCCSTRLLQHLYLFICFFSWHSGSRISIIADAILNRCLPASYIFFTTIHCCFPTLESIECHKASLALLTTLHWLLNTLPKWSLLQQTFRQR